MKHRKFIALIAAASIAVTGLTAAPAHAGQSDTAKIIAGAAVLALIGVAVANNRKSNRSRVSRSNTYDDGRYVGRRYEGHSSGSRRNEGHSSDGRRNDDSRYDGRRFNEDRYDDDDYNRPLPRRAQRKLLPRSCKVHARTRSGKVPAYSRRCLQNNYRYANSLPNRCSFKARTGRNGQRHTVYGRNCLANQGYRPANY